MSTELAQLLERDPAILDKFKSRVCQRWPFSISFDEANRKEISAWCKKSCTSEYMIGTGMMAQRIYLTSDKDATLAALMWSGR